MNHQRPYIYFLKILILILIITALPLPKLLIGLSPFWVLIFYTYWLIYSTPKLIFFIALILGILIDVIQGDILGQNALALILSSAFINSVNQSFSVSNLTTQQVYIFVASSIYLSTILLVHILAQGFDFNWYILFTPLSSAIFWPIIKLILTKYSH